MTTPLKAMSMAARASGVSYSRGSSNVYMTPAEYGTKTNDEVDSALKFSATSEMITEIKLATDPDDTELAGIPWEHHSFIVDATKEMLTTLESSLIITSETMKGTDIEVEKSDGSGTIKISAVVKEAVSKKFIAHTMVNGTTIMSEILHEFMNKFVNPMSAALLIEEKSAAKTQIIELIKRAGEYGGTEDTIKPAETPQSRIHFNDAVTALRELYEKANKMEDSYKKEMTRVDDAEEQVQSAVDDEDRDKFIKLTDEHRKRATSLKALADHKMNGVYNMLSEFYPDMSRSANTKTSGKSHALHEFKLPAGILSGKLDTTQASNVIASMLQVCQAWLEDFWALIPILIMMQQNEDRFIPVEPCSIAEACDESNYGPIMGSLYEKQMGRLWTMIARSNADIPGLVMNKTDQHQVTLFREIKTGGNGEPVRRSNVEIKNVMKLVAYITHYHEQELTNRRRQMTAVMKSAHTLFSKGSILKACERLQRHWQAAIELRVKVDWYSLIFQGSDILRHRSTDLWDPLTKNWIENEELKKAYGDDCLPVISQWLAEITSIARNMSSDSPAAHSNNEILAHAANLTAYADILGENTDTDTKTPTSAKFVDTSTLCEWNCGNVTCSEQILKSVKDNFLKRRENGGDKSKKAPEVMHLLCSSCHSVHAGGDDIKLSDGSMKRHYQSDPDAVNKKKDANKKRREKKKAAKATAKKKAGEESTAAKAANDPAAPAPVPAEPGQSGASSESGFDLSKLTLADAAKVSTMFKGLMAASVIEQAESASAFTVDKVVLTPDNVSVSQANTADSNTRTTSEPTGVFKKLMQAYNKSVTNGDYKQNDASSEMTTVNSLMASPSMAAEEWYVPD